MVLTVTPRHGEFRWTITIDGSLNPGPAARDGLEEAIDWMISMGGGPAQLWLRAVSEPADQFVMSFGFEPYRDLWQLRVDLPTEPSDLAVRPFVPDDIDELVAVNNRAFSWHPEQGALTRAAFDDRRSEAWFDPDGLLVHELEGAIAGFCWTKVDPDREPPMGEIYVICVDPAFHGRGIGAPLTRAGLDHLFASGLEVGMLYVESDNDAANHIYERIGFRRHHIDRAYRLDLPASTP